jgi:hypothetical protein
VAHVDPTRLMELALGHGAVPGDASLRHLAGCGHCREELRRTIRVVDAALGVQERDLPAAPPERVWQHIAEGIATADGTAVPPAPRSSASAPPPRTGCVPGAAGPPGHEAPCAPHRQDRRPRRALGVRDALAAVPGLLRRLRWPFGRRAVRRRERTEGR